MSSSGEGNVERVIALAQEVVDACRGLQVSREFTSGATAANAVISTLRDFQIYSETHSIHISLGSTDSVLTAHLTPCRQALEKMREIQKRHGQGSGNRVTRLMAKPEEKFERQTVALNDALHRLREMVQGLRQGAVRHVARPEEVSTHQQLEEIPPHSPAPSQQSTGQQDTNRQSTPSLPASVQSPVPIIINIVNSPQYGQPSQPQITHPVISSTTGFRTTTSNARTRLSMCPNGSACRTPSCHLNYEHPHARTCDKGKNCSIYGCNNWHPKSAWCPDGPSCNWRVNNCDKAHPWPLQETSSSQTSEPASQGSQGSGIVSEPSSQGSSYQGSPPIGTLSKSFSNMSLYINSQAAAPTITTRNNTPRASSNAQEWCPARFNCPGGYNGQCPLMHPKRAACLDGSACRKGAACTYDHSGQAQAQEAPANPRRAPYASRGTYSAARGGRTRAAPRGRAAAELPG
ncbi:hypothetical protein QBC43DRAFT_117059 [Cladorrhinum sp. PSN259]|nr:hypothetical protein QBC43DRAFT_117059 [Cladorrhinum sp. PSN259]